MGHQAYPQRLERGNPQLPTCDDRRENSPTTCKLTHARNSAPPCLEPSTSESHACTTKQIAAHVLQHLRTGSTTPSEDLGTSPIVPCAKTNGASGRTHTSVCPNPPMPSPTHCSATKTIGGNSNCFGFPVCQHKACMHDNVINN